MFVARYLGSWIWGSSPGSTQQAEQPLNDCRTDRNVVVTSLHVFPIKSCREIAVSSSRVTARGLEFDREWAMREKESKKIVTARDHPQLVLVTPCFDFEENVLSVSFPKDANLPGFSVRLRPDEQEAKTWTKTDESVFFGKMLPPAVLPPGVPSKKHPSTSPSPSEQLSTYLGLPVELIRASPDPTDKRIAKIPRGKPERDAWEAEVEERGESLVNFADEQPLTIASEASIRGVKAAVKDAAANEPVDSRFTNLGSLFDKKAWSDKDFDCKRFRSNIIVGLPKDLPQDAPEEAKQRAVDGEEDMEPFEEESWGQLSLAHPEDPDTESLPIHMIARCGRCLLPNVDPATGEADKVVPYKVMLKIRRVDPVIKFVPCFGVTAVSKDRANIREIRVGDIVTVTEGNNWAQIS